MTTGTGNVLSYAYDTLKRLQKVSVKSGSGTLFSTAYSYQNISDTQTTPRVRFRNVRVGDSGTLLEGKRYEYDALGNITRISQSVSPYYPLVEYSYDSQNQLIKETYYDGSGTGTAHVTDCYDYTYDTAGNLLTAAKNGTVTQTYTYGDSDWKDLLTSVNGASISYDSSGNPTSYSNSRGSYTYLRWDKGRQLSAIMVRVSGMEYATYDYDVNGIRTRKELNESGYIYYTQSGKLMREVGQFDGVTKRQVIDFIYDESGRPFAMNYSTDSGNSFTKYYYILNLQGDVVKLVTASGNTVAAYEYDAWGNILSQSGSMADKNPLRYRGYYYDVETGFYYLQSRYYDPANRRFINADSYASTGQGFVGVNMFAYCNNNPAVYADPHGYSIRPSTVAINDGGSTPSITTKTEIVAYINYNAADGPEIVAASPGAASSHSTGGIPPVGLNVPSAIGDPLYMIGTYRELRLITVGTGYEVHHLIPQRDRKFSGCVRVVCKSQKRRLGKTFLVLWTAL